VAKLGVACGEGALVLAFSLRKPCKEGKGNKKDGVGVVSFCFLFFLNFSLYIGSLKNVMTIMHESTFWWACYSKLYDKKGNVFLRSFHGIWWAGGYCPFSPFNFSLDIRSLKNFMTINTAHLECLLASLWAK